MQGKDGRRVIRKISVPPVFYAKPDYIGGHTFIGRPAQLQILTDWANPNDSTSILLFEAIGGNGKSMLTWEWTNAHAPGIRQWAGRFWYSFYERGAIMREFCQYALAYTTGRPVKDFERRQTAEMKDELLAQLHTRPWLFILDGLERVLVAYHRIDATAVRDEDVDAPIDRVLHRNPCDAIRDEDNDLLRALTAAGPSKILISSRLIPRVLLNQAGIPIPGVRPVRLPGLDDVDAESLLRACGITGSSSAIRYYLNAYCANHPLVIGVLAGLINSPGPHRGDFDAWSADPEGGAKLDLASLDLVQRRNHILQAALDSLSQPSRQLLSTLALLSDAVDYQTVSALNPHISPAPEKINEPAELERHRRWRDDIPDARKAKLRRQHDAALANRKAYELALHAWHDSVHDAPRKLTQTVQDLERRGLLQYDRHTNRYDMHPVVRAVTSTGMRREDKERYGQRVVDHFSSLAHNPYREAQTLADMIAGLQVVRTLLELGRFQQAAAFYRGDFSRALKFHVEGYAEILSLLHPFFPDGWGRLPRYLSNRDHHHTFANDVAVALNNCHAPHEAQAAYAAVLGFVLSTKNIGEAGITLRNMSRCLLRQNRLAKAIHVNSLSREFAELAQNEQELFAAKLFVFADHSLIGNWRNAEAAWQQLGSAIQSLSNSSVWRGRLEGYYARFRFWKGDLEETHLATAEKRAYEGQNRGRIRGLRRLRAEWHSDRGEWVQAAATFAEAVRMARESGICDARIETGLALAKHHLGQLAEPHRDEAHRLGRLRDPAHRYLAMLWLAVGDNDQAKHHALAAYAWAWADGEPYVNRYELTKAAELLLRVNVAIPASWPYDPTKEQIYPWEADVRDALEKLRAEKDAKGFNSPTDA